MLEDILNPFLPGRTVHLLHLTADVLESIFCRAFHVDWRVVFGGGEVEACGGGAAAGGQERQGHTVNHARQSSAALWTSFLE